MLTAIGIHADGLRLDLCRRPHVNQPVKIIVDDVIVKRSDVDAARGFIADASISARLPLGAMCRNTTAILEA